MAEQGACYGCCLNPGWFLNLPKPCDCFHFENAVRPAGSDKPTFAEWLLKEAKLTDAEMELLRKLGESWALYCNLDKRSEADNSEFLDGIHRLQQLVALRVARRVNPEVWAQP
jgi:hypothetical protein